MRKSNEEKYYHVTSGKCSGCSDELLAENGSHDEINLTWDEIQKYINPPKSIEEFRITKLAEIRKECENQIVAGFISDALGYEVHYRCNRDDQMMMRDAKDNRGGLLWRNETLTAHTQAQAQDVFAAMIVHRDETCKVKYANKMNYLNEPSRTIEEIEAVTWDSNE